MLHQQYLSKRYFQKQNCISSCLPTKVTDSERAGKSHWFLSSLQIWGDSHKNAHSTCRFSTQMGTTLFAGAEGMKRYFFFPLEIPARLGWVLLHLLWTQWHSEMQVGRGGGRTSHAALAPLFSSETHSTQKAVPDRCLKLSRAKCLLDSCKVICAKKNETQENPEAEKQSV